MSLRILALASLLLSGCMALAIKKPLTVDQTSSLGSLLKTARHLRQSFDSGNAVVPRQRRSPRQDNSPAADSKYGAPQGRKYEGDEGPYNQLAQGPYYNGAVRGPYDYAGPFNSLGGDEIPPISERSFDSLGGGEVPWFDRRSDGNVYDVRIQERAFDTLGGGEIPWIEGRSFGKREQKRK